MYFLNGIDSCYIMLSLLTTCTTTLTHINLLTLFQFLQLHKKNCFLSFNINIIHFKSSVLWVLAECATISVATPFNDTTHPSRWKGFLHLFSVMLMRSVDCDSANIKIKLIGKISWLCLNESESGSNLENW